MIIGARFKAVMFVAIMFLSLVGCGNEESEADGTPVLQFSAIPDDDESSLRARFEPLATYLGEELGLEVRYKPVAKYELAVAAMTAGDIHLAWFGGLTGVQARARTEGVAIAQGEEDARFYSYFIAHPSSGLERGEEFPAGIAGKTFTFGSKNSTSGRLMPEAFIRKHTGKSPAELFGRQPGFSGSHDKTIDAVASGAFMVGAVNGSTWEVKKREGKTGDAYVIWKTPEYADYNWSVHGEIDAIYGEGFRDRIKAALLALDPEVPRHATILAAFARKRFIPAANADYAEIAATAESLGLH